MLYFVYSQNNQSLRLVFVDFIQHLRYNKFIPVKGKHNVNYARIRIFENGICRYDLNYTDYAEVSENEIDYISIKSKFDDHIITKMHKDKVGIELSVLYDRMVRFLHIII